MQYGSKANLSTKSCSDISELEKKLVREIAQKLSKKLVETKNVALYTRSCQTTSCQLVGSPREKGVGEGGGGEVKRLLKALFGRGFAPKSSPLPLYVPFFTKGTPFVYLPLKSCTLFIYLLRENKSVRKEVFRSFSCNL